MDVVLTTIQKTKACSTT